MGDAMLVRPHECNWLDTGVDIGAFRAADDYAASAEELLQEVKDVPPAAGFDEVLLPGEPEARRAVERAASGVPIPESVWTEIKKAAAKVASRSTETRAQHRTTSAIPPLSVQI